MSKKIEKEETKKTKEKEEKAATAAVFSTGKRKKAVARASTRPGKGIVLFNSTPLEAIENRAVRLLLEEPLMLVKDAGKGLNIKVKTSGGGMMGQAQAARQAIARGLVGALGDDAKKTLMAYDRNMLVYDPRRTEPHKPPRSSQGPRRYKQKSKR